MITRTISGVAGKALQLDLWPHVTIATRRWGGGEQWRVTADRETWIRIAAAATRLGQGVDPTPTPVRTACRRLARRLARDPWR